MCVGEAGLPVETGSWRSGSGGGEHCGQAGKGCPAAGMWAVDEAPPGQQNDQGQRHCYVLLTFPPCALNRVIFITHQEAA